MNVFKIFFSYIILIYGFYDSLKYKGYICTTRFISLKWRWYVFFGWISRFDADDCAIGVRFVLLKVLMF